MAYYVYLLSNTTNSTIYTGVTNNLVKRVYEHKNKLDPYSFTARYHIHKLVYYEKHLMFILPLNGKSRSKAGTEAGRINWSTV